MTQYVGATSTNWVIGSNVTIIQWKLLMVKFGLWVDLVIVVIVVITMTRKSV
jgi:hypothetical protein